VKKKRIDYFFEVYEKGVIPKAFSNIYIDDELEVANPDYNEEWLRNSNTIFSVFFIPDYLRPSFNSELFSVKKVKQYFKGYTILLDDFDTVDAYIKNRFRSNAKAIRRRVKRLESCLDITYKIFYGSIKQEEYNFFMQQLKEMLVRRFEQRNDVSQSLTQWDRYQEMYFSLINEKKASLFVILQNNEPIVVSLNHHFQQRLFSAISSYDIDYAKFSLGNVEIYKKLDWCLTNDHNSYEMGMGDLTYKREWCNHIYHFEHQILYPKKSILAYCSASLIYFKASLKEFIYKIAYVRYKNFKASRKKDNHFDLPFSTAAIEPLDINLSYHAIDYTTQEYSFLRKPTFDFLYAAIEHVSNVKVLEISKEEKKYIIAGKSKMQHIAF